MQREDEVKYIYWSLSSGALCQRCNIFLKFHQIESHFLEVHHQGKPQLLYGCNIHGRDVEFRE